MGVQANQRISEEKGLFPPFSGFSRCRLGPPEKGEKGRKWAKKADFGRFPGRESRHPLSPHLLHPHMRHPESKTSGNDHLLTLVMLLGGFWPKGPDISLQLAGGFLKTSQTHVASDVFSGLQLLSLKNMGGKHLVEGTERRAHDG